MMDLHIKNMVCPRCIQAVRGILESMGLAVVQVNLGDAEIEGELSESQEVQLARLLEEQGFSLLDDPRSQLVEQIRVSVMEWVRMEAERPRLSDFLSRRLARDYSSLSKLFSEVRGITIERFAILHRIEYAKELLCYSQQSASQIAYQLGYSSPAHLTAQFKQVTGMTPKAFREQRDKHRIALSDI